MPDARWDAFCRKRDAIEAERQRLKATWLHPGKLPASEAERVFGKPLEREYHLHDLLRRPEASYASLMTLPGATEGRAEAALDPQVIEQVEIQAKYQGYIDRQQDEVARAAAYESQVLPADLDYETVVGLSKEVRGKLGQHRPETLGQASRIQGVTPAAISLLVIHLKKLTGRNGSAGQGASSAQSAA